MSNQIFKNVAKSTINSFTPMNGAQSIKLAHANIDVAK